jgi:DNA-directed RNA polymerase specialized sigma subunit
MIDIDTQKMPSGKRMNVPMITVLPEVLQQPELSLQEYDEITFKIVCYMYNNARKHRRELYTILHDQDALSYLTERLIWADATYDPQHGASLRNWRYTYVMYGIKNLTRNGIHTDKHVRDKSLYALQDVAKYDTLEIDVEDELQHLLGQTYLTERHVHCFKLRYSNYTFKEIGYLLSISKQRAKQIYDECIEELRRVANAD